MNPEAFSSSSGQPASRPPSDRFVQHNQGPDAMFLAHGAAADVWLLGRSQRMAQSYIAPTPTYEYRTDPSLETAGPSQAPTVSYHPTKKFVSKCIRISPESMIWYRKGPNNQNYKTQVTRWYSIKHKNVVKVLKFEESEGLNLLAEYCPHGTVRDRRWPEDLRLYDVIHSAVTGLRHLHELEPPIVHGSLNAGKIYFGEGNVVKLGEFGLALLAQEFATLVPTVSLAGISRWMSPELFDNDNALVPTTESDIWALGCTLYEILTRKLPYSNCIHDVEIVRRIKAGTKPGNVDDQDTSNGLSHLWPAVEDCWSIDPEERPQIEALTLKHEVRRTERQTQATLDPNAPPLNQLNSWITQLELELTWDSNRRVATRTWTAIPVVQGYPLTVYTGTGATNAAAQADAAGKIIASNILNTIMED